MNISYEFSKIRNGFKKVKEDMLFLSNKIGENYEEFTRRHKILANDVENLTLELKKSLEELRGKNFHSNENVLSKRDLNELREELKNLKSEVKEIQNDHSKFVSLVNDVKVNKKEIDELKEKLHSGELEVFLLKEKLVERDEEIKQMKEISRHLFNVVDELSKSELDILAYNKKNN